MKEGKLCLLLVVNVSDVKTVKIHFRTASMDVLYIGQHYQKIKAIQ